MTFESQIELYDQKNNFDLIKRLKLKSWHRILDFGCGRGELVHVLRNLGFFVEGVEIDDYFRWYAKANYNLRLHRDLGKLNGKFDVIILNSVLQYLDEPQKTIEELYDLTREGGIIYLETTNHDSLIHRVMRLVGKHPDEHFINKERLTNLLNSYKVERIWTSGGEGGRPKKFKKTYKLIIKLGEKIGMGHLLYCVAKKLTP